VAERARDPDLETVRRLYAAFNRHDLHELVEALSPDFEWHPNPEEPEQQVRLGRDSAMAGIRERWEALERLHTDVEELLAVAPHVVAAVRHTAVLKGADAEIERREVHVWSFDDRRPVRLREFPSWASALEALGASA
jgi:ketosteroid isomerase-like protein